LLERRLSMARNATSAYNHVYLAAPLNSIIIY
jgi:hypothetical protein